MKKIIILMVCLWGLGNTFTSAQTEGILPDPTVEIFLKKSMSGKAE